MKVLHVYKTSLPETFGGVETFIDTLCKFDSKLGVENTVLSLSTNPSDKPINMGAYIVHQAKQNIFIASTGFSLSAFKRFKLLAEKADIIHYHFPNPFADILHLACRPNKPSVVTYHSDVIKQKHLLKLYKPLKNRFLKSVDHIVTTSPNYFKSSEVLQQYAEKVSVIPIGIDIDSFQKVNKKRVEYWKKKLIAPFFLFVGALRYYKGLHTALEAIAGTDIRLVIAGGGGVEKDLKSQAAKLKLNNVDFLGFVSDEDKLALLSLCKGFIFPSHQRSEAFGISLLEASVFGKPIITCEIGTGTTYVNIANKTGLVIPPEAPKELREAMQYLLSDPKIADKMGQAARKRVETVFSAKKQAESYFNIYNKLSKKSL